jgi:hypothetical protein
MMSLFANGFGQVSAGEFDRSAGRITPRRSMSSSFCRTRLTS